MTRGGLPNSLDAGPPDADPPGHMTCDACWEVNPPPSSVMSFYMPVCEHQMSLIINLKLKGTSEIQKWLRRQFVTLREPLNV